MLKIDRLVLPIVCFMFCNMGNACQSLLAAGHRWLLEAPVVFKVLFGSQPPGCFQFLVSRGVFCCSRCDVVCQCNHYEVYDSISRERRRVHPRVRASWVAPWARITDPLALIVDPCAGLCAMRWTSQASQHGAVLHELVSLLSSSAGSESLDTWMFHVACPMVPRCADLRSKCPALAWDTKAATTA